jgi:RHS repeat-associated protein
MVKDGVSYRFVLDHSGSVRLVVNAATGAIAQRIDYDSFGNVLNDTNPGFQPFGFAGGLYDPTTGLVRFGARDYEPASGRWTAPDPVDFAGGDSNLYRYAHNDPINYRDADGFGEDSGDSVFGDWSTEVQLAKDLLEATGEVVGGKAKELNDWIDKILKPAEKFQKLIDNAEEIAEDFLTIDEALNDPTLTQGEKGLEVLDCIKDYLPEIPGWGDNPFDVDIFDEILDRVRDIRDDLRNGCGGYGGANCQSSFDN